MELLVLLYIFIYKRNRTNFFLINTVDFKIDTVLLMLFWVVPKEPVNILNVVSDLFYLYFCFF